MASGRFVAVLAAMGLVASGVALADDPLYGAGGYVSGSIGYFVPRDVSGTVSGINATAEYDRGLHISGALGYKFGNGFRAEGEIGYANTGVDRISGNGTTVDLSGDIDLVSVMAFGYYDIKAGTRWSPYIGAGIGAVHADVSRHTANLGGTTVTLTGGTSTDLAVAGEIGISFAATDSIIVAPAYRYTWINNGANGIDDDTAHTFKLGLRFAF